MAANSLIRSPAVASMGNGVGITDPFHRKTNSVTLSEILKTTYRILNCVLLDIVGLAVVGLAVY